MINMKLQLFASNKTIFDIVTAENVKGYYEETIEGKIQPLGAMLFPRDKQLGLELSFIKGKGGIPVVLKPSAFDVRATLRDRVGLTELKTDMPFFKESMIVKEKDRQDLLTMLQTGNEAYINMVTKRIFDDKRTLLDGAEASEERLRMQLLTQGKIAVVANNVDLEYDYGMPTENKLAAEKSWSDPSANIGKEIMKWIMDAKKKGITLTRAITNSSTILNLMENTAIKKEILSKSEGIGVITPTMIGQWIKSKFGLTIMLYDEVFIDENGITKQYVPDGIFTLIPAGTLGTTMFGTTPEEADLMSGATDAQVAIVNTGVAVTTTKQTDPVNVETKVSMITLPSFEQIDKVFIINVA
ncbi:major capsid protein [Tissierella carlieri]|uniref:Major capsid protein n=1 Tax=Tissierella carlieri TaxID=689904 RepID=A0ABT1S5C1_9FIRM|nr:major capsid protein [Tissierella carlieri]MCQ4921555.1 major capsid protein [Tissierella carlieri]